MGTLPIWRLYKLHRHKHYVLLLVCAFWSKFHLAIKCVELGDRMLALPYVASVVFVVETYEPNILTSREGRGGPEASLVAVVVRYSPLLAPLQQKVVFIPP